MAHLTVDGLVNTARPDLQCRSVSELPTNELDAESLLKLETSLEVNSSDLVACSRSARLWESLLEEKRIPFLLLKVADMRFVLDSKATAFELYEELQSILQSSRLQAWIFQTKSEFNTEVETQLKLHNTPAFLSASQRWKSSIEFDYAFPYCRIQSPRLMDLRARWQKGGPSLQEQFIILHCLETNFLEDIFHFSPNVANQLLQRGFDNGTPFTPDDIINGELRDPSEALSVLRDTRKSLDKLYELFGDSVELTTDLVCHLHMIVMDTCRIRCVQKCGSTRIDYTNSGITRQRSCVNVIIRSGKTTVQFCPHNQVDEELNVFCNRFNTLLRQGDMDPFAAAAWINFVFTSIHPFEDGNGRVSRLLSSVPLIRKGFPPLCISASQKDSYVTELNKIRSFRNGDYEELMEYFFTNTTASLECLERDRNLQ